jgi:uncharacterized protein YvpB
MSKSGTEAVWNTLSLILLGSTALTCLCYAAVFLAPALAGPLAWPTPMDQAALPSGTPTSPGPIWPATWTPTITRTPQPSNTPVKISTSAPTSTLTPTAANATAAAGLKRVGQSALIPASATPAIANRTVLLRVPVLGQARHLTCEAATARMAAVYLGKPVTEAWMQAQFGQDDNPHKGFRGNVDGQFGGVYDYGVYAEPVAQALRALGLNADVRYGASYADLRAALDGGRPVIVWLSLFDAPGYYNQPGGYRLVPGEHTYVVVGYQAARLIVNDPGLGGRRFYIRAIPHWELFNNMAVFVGK